MAAQAMMQPITIPKAAIHLTCQLHYAWHTPMSAPLRFFCYRCIEYVTKCPCGKRSCPMPWVDLTADLPPQPPRQYTGAQVYSNQHSIIMPKGWSTHTNQAEPKDQDLPTGKKKPKRKI